MKNLKKVLSLVLALAMAFSLMSVAFAVDTASDFTDYDEIDYQDAVDVMTAIGVFNGYDDGTSFNPNGTLTREQGAKIITYMLLGQSAADKLETSVAPFSDVPASKWSAGSIAYCAERSILAGDGTGKFNPEDTLTGYAFAKMLLIALGYDATVQNYVGGSWAINVAADAVTAGIDITGVVLSNTLTREQAAQMAFQTLEADMVSYPNGKGSTVTTSDGTSITVGASSFSKVSQASSTVDYTTDSTTGDNYQQFVEKYYPKLKKAENANDSFNRPGTRWTLDGTAVSFVTDETVATFTSKTTAADVATALAGYKVQFTSNGETKTYNITNVNTLATGVSGTTNTYWNGHDSAYAVSADVSAPISYGTSKTIATSIADITANGKLVEFYADDDNVITRVVTVTYNVAELANIVTNSSRTIYTLDNSSYIDYVDANVTDTVKLHGDVAVGDIVTYTVIGGVAHIYPTTQVTGSQTSNNTGSNQITVGGTVYPVGVGVFTNATFSEKVKIGDFVNSTNEATYYIDQFGNVVKSTSALSSEYAFVYATAATLSSGLDSGVPAVSVRLILEDGTVVDRTLEIEKLTANDTRVGTNGLAAGDYVVKGTSIQVYDASVDTTSANVATRVSSALRSNIYGYSLSDTSVTLSNITAVTTSGQLTTSNGIYSVAFDVTADSSPINKSTNSYTINGKTVLISTDTVFVIYNANGTTSVYTGSSSLPTAINDTRLSVAKIVYKASTSNSGNSTENITTGTAEVVFAVNAEDTALTADASNYAYVNPENYVSTLDNGVTTYVYTATLPDSTTLELSSTTLYTAAGIYSYTDNNTISAAVRTANNDGQVLGTRYAYVDTFQSTSSFVQVGSSYYTITADTKIVYINENAGAVNGNGGYVVLQVTNGTVTGNVDTIYVTVAH